MPSEPIIRYFQVASSDFSLWLKWTRGAAAKVAASMPTHNSPMWRLTQTRLTAPRMNDRQAVNSRLSRPSRRRRYSRQ